MSNRRTRRRFLRAVGAVGAVGLAGCSEGASEPTPTERTRTVAETPQTESATATETDTPEPETATETDTAEPETATGTPDEYGPEATVRAYFEAYRDGDAETVDSYLHPESRLGTEYVGEYDLTIDGVERTTLSEIADDESLDLGDEELGAATDTVEDDVDGVGAEAYATVRYSIETDEFGAVTSYLLLVREGEQWYVYTDQVVGYLTAAGTGEGTEASPTEPTEG